MPSGKPRKHKGPAPARVEPAKGQSPASLHRLALRRRIEELEAITLDGWKELTRKDGFPELEQLRLACLELLFVSDPAHGRNLDTDHRGSGDSLSSDGLSTSEGRSTLRPRSKLNYFRRRIDALAKDMLDARNPDIAPHRVARPRCNQAGCGWRGRVQSVGAKVCGWCGESLISQVTTEAG